MLRSRVARPVALTERAPARWPWRRPGLSQSRRSEKDAVGRTNRGGGTQVDRAREPPGASGDHRVTGRRSRLSALETAGTPATCATSALRRHGTRDQRSKAMYCSYPRRDGMRAPLQSNPPRLTPANEDIRLPAVAPAVVPLLLGSVPCRYAEVR